MRETACGAGVPEGSVAVPGSGRTPRRARSELSSSLGQERGVLQVDAGRRGGACHLTLCVRRAALRSERTGVTVALPSHFPVQHLTTFIKWTLTTKNFPLFILSTSVSTRIRGHLVRSVLNPPLPQTRPAGTSDWSPCPVTHFRRLLSQPRRVLPPPTQSAISPGGTGPRGHGLPRGGAWPAPWGAWPALRGVACPCGAWPARAGRGLPHAGAWSAPCGRHAADAEKTPCDGIDGTNGGRRISNEQGVKQCLCVMTELVGGIDLL